VAFAEICFGIERSTDAGWRAELNDWLAHDRGDALSSLATNRSIRAVQFHEGDNRQEDDRK
jgi:hypothetical protein